MVRPGVTPKIWYLAGYLGSTPMEQDKDQDQDHDGIKARRGYDAVLAFVFGYLYRKQEYRHRFSIYDSN